MASPTLSLSLTTVSSSSSSRRFSQAKTSIFNSKAPSVTALSSSLLGTRVGVKTTKANSVIRRSASIGVTCSASSSTLPSALLFDCDGVLVDTEKDGHRISFNDTFTERELGVSWDVDLYGELLKIGGGKERMTAYFNKVGWPEKAPKSEEERKEFIASLHKQKTELFMALIEKKLLPLRPGVAKLIDQALAKGVQVAVCSTSNEKAVSAIVSCLLGPERAEKIKIFAGDVVPRKKPDPAIYLLAADTLGVDPSSCVVVEDSAIGLAAAKAAGMKCIVTKSGYTADEDFLNADAVFDCIGDPPEERFDLAFCGSLLEKQYASLTWKQQKQSNSSIFTTVELPPPKTLAVSVNTNGRQLIQSDIVRPITPKEATTIMNSEGFRLLDVRPMWEKQKAYVKDSLHVPLFVNDTDNSPITLLKKWVHFGYIGLWTGQKFTTFNPNFLAQMEAIVPDKNSKLLVACGEGLRSMMAISKLHEQGYKNLGWLVGGFSRCTDGDFLEVEGNEKLQYATIGGVSYYLLRLLILLRVVGNDAN